MPELNPIDAAKYLARYGYLGTTTMAAARVEMLADGEALRQFQSFAGLPVTGLLDAETAAKMQMPRCGVPDVGRLSSPGAALAAKWRKTRLTYFIEKRVPQLDATTVDSQIRMAFGFWSDVADINFSETTSRNNADLILSIGSGPADNFDGPGKVLAWAYLPDGSDHPLHMKFDAVESWTVSGSGIRFPNVAAHEFGHMLGLEHSHVQAALMAPFYSQAIAKPQPNDDIPRIQALYGPPVAVPPVPTPGGTICDMVRDCLKQFNTIRHAEKFTMAGIEFNEQDRQALNKLVEAATNPTCQKITELLAKIGAACPAPAPAFRSEPAIGGGLCAGLTGILQLLPLLQQLLAMCKTTT